MNVKKHYDDHLGNFYSWMVGDFEIKQNEHQHFLETNNIVPSSSRIAIDLGAGHGIQSVSLAKLGFSVKAIDFNKQLLEELKTNSVGLDIEIIEEDMHSIKNYAPLKPELIICWGDTLTHLDDKKNIEEFISGICATVVQNGKVILSFREYSNVLEGDSRFIPVKSDSDKILTCFLEYEKEQVTVTDLLHEKTESGWRQKVSSYKKVRISTEEIMLYLENNSMKIIVNQLLNRMVTIIALKL